ncbi:MAG: alcohol dehydrogenase catalytic domain-containing protein, partial [Acetobacteraceae bacterium]|nr:alcohol dehydrogenase catalytic domain-containing protein [Acetobacteraceae bacterium]
MRAAVKRGNWILCDEIAEPTPAAGQVLVRTCACGICGSDLHALQFPQAVTRIYELSGVDHPLDADADVVLGHELTAEILDFGPATERKLRQGSLVTSVPRLIDRGRAHVVGYSNAFPGGYAERMLLSKQLLLPIPNGLSALEAALTEPFSVGEHAAAAARLDGAGGRTGDRLRAGWARGHRSLEGTRLRAGDCSRFRAGPPRARRTARGGQSG